MEVSELMSEDGQRKILGYERLCSVKTELISNHQPEIEPAPRAGSNRLFARKVTGKEESGTESGTKLSDK